MFPINRSVYEIMWKNMVQPDRQQVATWRMHIACWVPKATDTLSEYIILIAFPLQQWLRERASVLRTRTFILLFFILQSLCIFLQMLFLYIVYLNLSPLCSSQIVPLSPIKLTTHIKSYNIITFLHSYLFHKF